jgi:hypothetical protein
MIFLPLSETLGTSSSNFILIILIYHDQKNICCKVLFLVVQINQDYQKKLDRNIFIKSLETA